MKISDSFRKSMREMASLTEPKCSTCRAPYSCCSREYGWQVEMEFPKESRNFKKTDDPKSKCQFLLEDGCSVPPEYRILCTIHVCEQHLRDPEFSDKYFSLREELNNLMNGG